METKYFSHNKEHKELKNVLYYKTGEIFFGKNKETNELYSIPEYSNNIKIEIDNLCSTLQDDEWYEYELIEKIINIICFTH